MSIVQYNHQPTITTHPLFKTIHSGIPSSSGFTEVTDMFPPDRKKKQRLVGPPSSSPGAMKAGPVLDLECGASGHFWSFLVDGLWFGGSHIALRTLKGKQDVKESRSVV